MKDFGGAPRTASAVVCRGRGIDLVSPGDESALADCSQLRSRAAWRWAQAAVPLQGGMIGGDVLGRVLLELRDHTSCVGSSRSAAWAKLLARNVIFSFSGATPLIGRGRMILFPRRTDRLATRRAPLETSITICASRNFAARRRASTLCPAKG